MYVDGFPVCGFHDVRGRVYKFGGQLDPSSVWFSPPRSQEGERLSPESLVMTLFSIPIGKY